MSASSKLAQVEARLFLRDPGSLFFGLLFPGILLLLLGLFFPGFKDPSPDLGGRAFIDFYVSVVLVFGLATLGVVTLPPTLATYRQFGILRRLRATPVHPFRLLRAQLVVHLAIAVVAALGTIVVATAVFDVPLPQRPVWFVVSWGLSAASIFSVGLLVAARARSSASGQGIGMAIYFPLLFFAGVWIPRSVMSDGLRTLSDFTPVGAAAQALEDSWMGAAPSLQHLLVMALWAVGMGVLSVRVFRWE